MVAQCSRDRVLSPWWGSSQPEHFPCRRSQACLCFLSAALPPVDVDVEWKWKEGPLLTSLGAASASAQAGDFLVLFTREAGSPIFHFMPECPGVSGSLCCSIIVPIKHWECMQIELTPS